MFKLSKNGIKRFLRGEKIDLNDFEHCCCFRHQLNYAGLKDGNGELVEVPFVSGKTGIYKVTSEDYTPFNHTGQKNWYFKFLHFKKDN